MYKNIHWDTRQSRLAKKIETWFQRHGELITFGKILDKHCKIGMSRHHVTRVLTSITNGEIKIRPNTLDEAIKAAIQQQKTKFRIEARVKDNPYHGLQGFKRSKKKTTSSPKTTQVQFICLQCKHKTKRETFLTKEMLIGIQTFQCPHCQALGNAVAQFIHKNKKYIKSCNNDREITQIIEIKRRNDDDSEIHSHQKGVTI